MDQGLPRLGRFFVFGFFRFGRQAVGRFSQSSTAAPTAACSCDAMFQQPWGLPADWSCVETASQADSGASTSTVSSGAGWCWCLAQSMPFNHWPEDCGVPIRGDGGTWIHSKLGDPRRTHLLRLSRAIGGAKAAPHLPSAGVHARALLEHSWEGPLPALGCNAAPPLCRSVARQCT